MPKSKKIVSSILIFSCIFLFGCADKESMSISKDRNENNKELVDSSTGWSIESSPLNGITLKENKNIYKQDVDNEVVTLYLTLYPTPDKNGNMLTMEDFDDVEAHERYTPELEVLVQEGDDKGPSAGKLGSSTSEPNGTIGVRGQSSRGGLYKSFKVKLYDRAGTWRGQKTLLLNKHPFDATKITNKFSFDYFEKIPNMTSLRTQFVHVYVKDMASQAKEFVDYGLYTHIEQANKTFLRGHGLDDTGNIYKAKSFEFLRYEDKLKAEDDPTYDAAVFETVLNIREGKSHKKLIKMLEDVNNMNLDFNEVFNKHFNKDNYLTWMAVNILFGNEDTLSQNFMLYSPQNSMTWYFLPWDYDGSMKYGERKGRSNVVDSMYGIGRYWGVILHKRFFRNPENVEALTSKINELMTIITPENTKALTDSYKSVIKKFLYKMPDIAMLRTDPTEVEPYLDSYQKIIEYNRERYLKALQNPMPVFTSEPAKNGDGSFTFSWEASYDLQRDLITYDLEIAKDYKFSNLVFQKKDIKETTINVPALTSGIYYWRLTIKDDKGNVQVTFNNYFPEEEEATLWGVSQWLVH